MEIFRLNDFQQLAFHHQRKLLHDGRVDMRTLYGVITGPFKFIRHGVAGCHTEKVRDIHVLPIRNADGERFDRADILRRLVSLADDQRDLIHTAYRSPGRVHHIDLALFIVCRYHQHRHRKYGGQFSQIFFHHRSPPCCSVFSILFLG